MIFVHSLTITSSFVLLFGMKLLISFLLVTTTYLSLWSCTGNFKESENRSKVCNVHIEYTAHQSSTSNFPEPVGLKLLDWSVMLQDQFKGQSAECNITVSLNYTKLATLSTKTWRRAKQMERKMAFKRNRTQDLLSSTQMACQLC